MASVGPVGTLVFVVFVAGLAAFAVWQVSDAVAGSRWVSGGERRRKRIGALAKAVAVVAIAVIAGRFVVGSPGGSGRTGPEWLVRSLLELPGGHWLVAAVAAFVLVVAGIMVYTGVARTFLGDLLDDVAPASASDSRGLHTDPGRVGGLNEALRGLVGGWRGIAPLLVLSAEMAAFGGYCLIGSRYRRA